ncbi:chromate efflux transporter [Paenibacillus sp. CAU 1782]
MPQSQPIRQPKASLKSRLEILWVATKLGLTSFGGPIAHLGYFHNEYVKRRQWVDEKSYADMVALSQFLPGPASSQVGIAIGIQRAGLWGGLLAFLGFTLPSVVALIGFALLLQHFSIADAGWLRGLKLVAVAIVAQAVAGMAQKLAHDKIRMSIAFIVAVASLLWQSSFSHVVLIAAAGITGAYWFREQEATKRESLHVGISKKIGLLLLALFLALLIALPIIRSAISLDAIAVFDSFYRAGSLVFGGGHVVLPLLERELVPSGWISKDSFLEGYGAAQAVPGPLFTFAAYIGAIIGGWPMALLATAAIFLPGFLLIAGALPFWHSIGRFKRMQGAFKGINAAVVGLLLGAFYSPIWTDSIMQPADFGLAAILFCLLVYWRCPPWLVVIAGTAGGTALSLL